MFSRGRLATGFMCTNGDGRDREVLAGVAGITAEAAAEAVAALGRRHRPLPGGGLLVVGGGRAGSRGPYTLTWTWS